MHLTDEYGIRPIVFILGIILVVILLVTCGAIVNYFAERQTCQNEAHEMDREWKFGLFIPCMVQLNNGTWIDIEKYRLQNSEQD